MNLMDTVEEAAFRKKVRAWIDANAPKEFERQLELTMRLETEDPLAVAKAWQKKKYDGGWAIPQWPKEYGGGGATPIQRVIWGQEEGVYGRLASAFSIGIGMCGPTVMDWASEEWKRKLLPKLASGEEIWCQLFSEPVAGSDLAGIRTRAVRDGDDWIINGQKIWTSGAHISDWGLLLTRTDPTVAKHKGLTMFFMDMHAPGVEVRPIKQASGDSEFNEVFFTDLRVPDSQRLGALGQGWTVALTTLMNERYSIGGSMSTGYSELLEMCKRLETPYGRAIDDPRVRSRLADFAVRAKGLKYTSFRSISALSKGELPGPENSIGKLVAANTLQEIARFALDLQGEAGLIDDPEQASDGGRFQAMLLSSPGIRIAGGTDEIMRNIIAERVLGLPADVRVDKDVPFQQIPTAATASR